MLLFDRGYFYIFVVFKKKDRFWLGGAAPQTLRFWAGGAKPPDPPLKRSFVTFDRGGQTGPPRSNVFFFGAADDTRAADDRPAGRPGMVWIRVWSFVSVMTITFRACTPIRTISDRAQNIYRVMTLRDS